MYNMYMYIHMLRMHMYTLSYTTAIKISLGPERDSFGPERVWVEGSGAFDR
jgi:hypothetical protein